MDDLHMELYTTSITFGPLPLLASDLNYPKSQSDGGAVTYEPALFLLFQLFFFFLLQPLNLRVCGSNVFSWISSILILTLIVLFIPISILILIF